MTKWIGLLVALMILLTPVIWQVASAADPSSSTQGNSSTPNEESVVAALQAEVRALRRDVEQLRGRVDGLDSRTSIGLSNAAPQFRAPVAPTAIPLPPPEDSLRDSFDQVVLIGARRAANKGLSVATPSFLESMFGLPRPDLTDECQAMANPRLIELLRTEDVGPIRVSMLAPAVASLRQIFAEVEAFEPELYNRLASSGSLCVRLIRGSTASASAHAYGLAVDINVDGVLDNFADGKTQLGLILMADYFSAAGWIWGAGFSREDSMHFEVSREKIQEWRDLGLL